MAELTSYSAGLVDKPMIAVITKMDLPENHEPAAKMEAFLRDSGVPVYKVRQSRDSEYSNSSVQQPRRSLNFETANECRGRQTRGAVPGYGGSS